MIKEQISIAVSILNEKMTLNAKFPLVLFYFLFSCQCNNKIHIINIFSLYIYLGRERGINLRRDGRLWQGPGVDKEVIVLLNHKDLGSPALKGSLVSTSPSGHAKSRNFCTRH